MDPFHIGVIGCGNISRAYLEYAQKFPILEVTACADLEIENARERAGQFGINRACHTDDLLADDSVDLVLNLTIPAVHAEISIQALEAGKHVWSEKPLALDREEGRRVLEAAKRNDRRIGCAPDTFLGAGIQTARKVIDDGGIGEPLFATAFMVSPGHETWHPNPAFFYQAGGGPMFDMGPYYLTALMQLLGPVDRVSGESRIARNPRTITSEPLKGTKIDVETPDHVTGTLRFVSGTTATVVTTFAGYHSPHPPITVFGTEGTLAVPDPNGFDGEVQLQLADEGHFHTIPHTHRLGHGRAVGAAEMCHAIRGDRPHRASGEQAYAVLETMQAFLESSERGEYVTVEGDYERTAALPTELPEGAFDE